MSARFSKFIRSNFMLTIISLLLITVGIVITNLYLASPFSFDTFAQIMGIAASIATLVALGIAIQSLNEWKNQHRATRLDNRFYELRRAYMDASTAFYNYFNNEVSLLSAKHDVYQRFTPGKGKNLRSLEIESQSLNTAFLKALSMYHRQFYFTKAELCFLTSMELVELESVQVGWYEALQCIDVSEIDYVDYTAVNTARKRGYEILKKSTAAIESLLTKVAKRIERQFS